MNDVHLGWTVVLPLKGGPAAKSRLSAPAPLATAIALDCLAAVLGCDLVDAVVVVTPDPELAGQASTLGAQVRPEAISGGGLLAALNDGLAGLDGRCAVLLGDLPALRPEDLGAALRQAGALLAGPAAPGSGPGSAPPRMVFVPDAEGTGTVLLAALSATAMVPSFGPASASTHRRAGAVRLDVDRPRLRRDVDTPADLEQAVELGIGPRTEAVLAQLANQAGRGESEAAPSRNGVSAAESDAEPAGNRA